MPGTPKPVTIRGVSYPSLAQAARELGLSFSSIYQAKYKDNLQLCGLRPMKTSAIIVLASKATPEDLPLLRSEAIKWLNKRTS